MRGDKSDSDPAKLTSSLKFMGEDTRYIVDNFSHVRLVGAVIRLTYIGRVEDESGFMACSHTYGDTPFTVGEDEIEEGWHCLRARPNEGMRMIWLPRCDEDLEMRECSTKLNGMSTNPATIDVINPNEYYPGNRGQGGGGDNEILSEANWEVQRLMISNDGTYGWGRADNIEVSP